MTHRSHLFKRWAAALLSACLLLTLLPTAALAEDTPLVVYHGDTIQNDTDESMEVVCGTNSLPYTIPADGKFVYVELGSNLETYEVADDVTHVLATSLGEEVEGGLQFADEYDRASVDLTADNLRQCGTAGHTAALILPDDSTLTVRGDCAFTGASAQSGGTAGIVLSGNSTLTVEQGASLTAKGGDDSDYSSGVFVDSLTLINHGRIECYGGKNTADGTYWPNSSGISIMKHIAIRGSGALSCLGAQGIAANVDTDDPVTVSLEGGSVTAVGSAHGIYTQGGAVTVAAGVNAQVIGGVEGTVEGDTSGLTVIDQTLDEIITEGDALDLTGETAEKLFLVEGQDYGGVPTPLGTVQWQPATDGAHAKLVISAFRPESGLRLNGISLASDTDIELSAGTMLAPGYDVTAERSLPSVIAPDRALTFHTDYLETDPEHSFRPWIIGLSAASAAFTGGDFSTDETLDAPVTVRDATGSVEMHGTAQEGLQEAVVLSPIPNGLTILPAANTHGVLYAIDTDTEARFLPAVGETLRTLAGPSNSTITYAGSEGHLFAAIVPGAAEEEEEHHNSSSSGTPTYAVVYHANYANGPADVRDSGHRSGASVTLKAADLFKAPEGKTFAGWAESASGSVKYKASEQIKMPANTLNLYAVWNAKGTAPGLNQEDHIAYLSGYPDGSAQPEANITREEVAAIFYRLLDDATRDAYHTTSSPFPDVASSRWSAEAIATLANAGILKGERDGKFYPERPITRAEFAAIAARFDPSDYDGADQFPDIANHWAKNEINHAYMRGWVRGTPDGRFEPDRYITRAEAVTLVNRVLNRAPESASDLLPGMQTFTDNTDAARWYYLDIQEAANAHDYDRKADGVHEKWTALR